MSLAGASSTSSDLVGSPRRSRGAIEVPQGEVPGRLHRWRERVWGRRYRAIVVSHEKAAQIERLRYLLEQGTKEGLVRRPEDWPGAHSVQALLDGRPIRGIWFDRSQEYEARRCGKRPGKYEFAEEETFELTSLPAWDSLDGETIRERSAPWCERSPPRDARPGGPLADRRWASAASCVKTPTPDPSARNARRRRASTPRTGR